MRQGATPAILTRAHEHGGRTAIVDGYGAHSYDALLSSAVRVSGALLQGREDLNEERVAFLVTPGYSWVAVLWGVWLAGGIAVPLPLGAPASELEYILDDTQAAAVVFDEDNEKVLRPIAATRHCAAYSAREMLAHAAAAELPTITPERRA